jgi:predicted small secreted protein
MSILLRVVVMLVLASLFSWLTGCRTPRGAGSQPATGRLQSLAIYYGWPSVAGGARSPEEAAGKLAAYEVVVLGGGLERAEHGDHARTRAIVARLASRAEVYGYIPLGSATGHSLEAITTAVGRWREIGVAGIFFDEAGKDFGVSRERQNAAFAAAHRAKLRVFANAFEPDDLFEGRPEVELARGDCYLYESFGVRLSEPEDEQARAAKLAKLTAARRRGVRLFGVSTSVAGRAPSSAELTTLVALARRSGLDGIGWGTPDFGARDGALPPPLALEPTRAHQP